MVRIGQVVGVHGIDGGMKLLPESDQWRQWPTSLRRVRIDRLGETPVAVRRVRLLTDRPVLVVEGVQDRDAAERLRGAIVFRPLEDLPRLEPDSYYWHDLAGRPVVARDGTPVGTVEAVEPGPAHDWLVVEGPAKTVLVPFVRAWVRVASDGPIELLSDPEGT